MNTKLNKIFKSFDDVKLESQEVELSLKDDAVKAINGVLQSYNNPIWNTLERLPNEVAEVIARAKDELQKAGKFQSEAILKAREVSKMAKELGVEIPKEIDAIFKNNDYDELRLAYSDSIDKLISKIKK